jgi:predicted exporter
MSLLARLRYALYLAAVSAAVASLIIALASAEGIGLLPSAIFEALFSPAVLFAWCLTAFMVTPWIADRVPVDGDSIQANHQKQTFGYTARALMLVTLGLVLAVLANFVVFLMAKLT